MRSFGVIFVAASFIGLVSCASIGEMVQMPLGVVENLPGGDMVRQMPGYDMVEGAVGNVGAMADNAMGSMGMNGRLFEMGSSSLPGLGLVSDATNAASGLMSAASLASNLMGRGVFDDVAEAAQGGANRVSNLMNNVPGSELVNGGMQAEADIIDGIVPDDMPGSDIVEQGTNVLRQFRIFL